MDGTDTDRIDTVDGPMDLIVAAPDGSSRGGVVVVQEAFGLTPHIASVCRRLADDGWLAVAPALFHRTGAPVIEYGDLASVMPHFAEVSAAGLEVDVAAALDVLDGAGVEAGRRGIVGFCMGGTVALWAGTAFPLGAAVTFYGGGVTSGRFGLPALVDLAPSLRCPWQGHFGDLDEGIPVDQVEALRAAATTAAVDTEVHRYAGAGHGFNCDDRDAFHGPSAAQAWDRTLAWFATHLDR
jgi:carboxymethylenebutenolidase